MARRTASNGSAPTPSHQSQPSQSVSPRQQRAQRHRSQPSQSGSSSNPQSNTQNQHNQAAQPEQQQQQPQQQQQQQPQQPQRPLQLQQEPRDFGMSPHHRYDHNMKVLRRRDSSIVSIFDQFSHVCVYHHNGEKWEKQGFEGSMFLYERNAYPPYGFYILNRVGMGDHIQRIYPEDNFSAGGNYLMLRSYPDFTEQRLETVHAQFRGAEPDKFSDAFTIPGLETMKPEQKGRSQVIGLWMFATDAREPMINVMMRLHSYIKQNLPYPEEYRYGPDRPPPPNPHNREPSTSPNQPRAVTTSTTTTTTTVATTTTTQQVPVQNTNTQPNGSTELDKLFSKLAPAQLTTNAMHQLDQGSQSQEPAKLTVDSLFAAIGGGQPAVSTPTPAPFPEKRQQQQQRPKQSSTPSVPSSTTGLDLLNSIFASADTSKPVNNQWPSNQATTETQYQTSTQAHFQAALTEEASPQQLHYPKPRPQVLDQEVIFGLMGLPSRSASAASNANSTSTQSANSGHSPAHSHPNSRGGNSGVDVSNSTGRSSVRPHQSTGVAHTATTNRQPLIQDVKVSVEYELLNGDVTPRPPPTNLAAMGSWQHQPTTGGSIPPNGLYARSHTSLDILKPMEHSLSNTTIRAGSNYAPELERAKSCLADLAPPLGGDVQFAMTPSTPARNKAAVVSAPPTTSKTAATAASVQRPLVPFQTDSDLWPYPRAPLDDRGDGDEDVIELDFAEISALTDPDQWRQKSLSQQSGKARATFQSPEKDKEPANVNGKKKTKKERLADNERERVAIEQSWDTPTAAAAVSPPHKQAQQQRWGHAADSVPQSALPPSPPPAHADAAAYLREFGADPPPRNQPHPQQPLKGVHAAVSNVNGRHTPAANGRQATPQGTTLSRGNGTPAPIPTSTSQQPKTSPQAANGSGSGLDKERVQQIILSNAVGRLPPATAIEKNDFIRELLTLIHSDRAFADALWRGYVDQGHVA